MILNITENLYSTLHHVAILLCFWEQNWWHSYHTECTNTKDKRVNKTLVILKIIISLIEVEISDLMMKVLLVLCLAMASTMSAPDTRFSCSECVDEMHHLGLWVIIYLLTIINFTFFYSLIREGHEAITAYLQTNYCPTSDDVEECEEHLAFYYPHMLVFGIFLKTLMNYQYL